MRRKVLSVIMAVVMMISCFALMASAYTYSPSLTTGEVKISATADKTTVSPGDTVKITMTIDPGSKTDWAAFGNTIVYNGEQLTPVGSKITEFRTWEGDCAASFANPNAAGNMNFDTAKMLKAQMTEEELAYFNKGIMILGSATSSAKRWAPKAGEAYLSFKMTVSDSVKPGDEIWVGTHNATFVRGTTYFALGSKRMANTEYDLTNSMVKLTVAGAEPSYSVAKYKTQVKFTGDKTTAPDDLFQFRLTSVITAADFAAMNSNGNTIKSVGFIAANTGAADADAAKAAVEKGTALPSAWKAASTDYVSRADASSDAYFGAIIKNISHASQATDIDCIAYVCYNDGTADHYVWYSAAVTAKVASGYDAAVAAWKAQ
jgi:hypothetical protein